MKTIQLTFLFEDTGFCKDVFQSVNQPYYYCNRDTVDGTWYTSTPDDYQNDCRIRKDVIIEIISDGQVIALDGNGDFEGKKPFIPFYRSRIYSEHHRYSLPFGPKSRNSGSHNLHPHFDAPEA